MAQRKPYLSTIGFGNHRVSKGFAQGQWKRSKEEEEKKGEESNVLTTDVFIITSIKGNALDEYKFINIPLGTLNYKTFT